MKREKVDELKDLLLDLVERIEAYGLYKATREQAQKDEDEAMHRLNETQKTVDAALLELRTLSPSGSVWGSGLKSEVKAPDLNPDPNGWKDKLEEIRAKDLFRVVTPS